MGSQEAGVVKSICSTRLFDVGVSRNHVLKSMWGEVSEVLGCRGHGGCTAVLPVLDEMYQGVRPEDCW